MKHPLIREKLHLYVDILPLAVLDEIYLLIGEKCAANAQHCVTVPEDVLTEIETDLLVQHFLA